MGPIVGLQTASDRLHVANLGVTRPGRLLHLPQIVDIACSNKTVSGKKKEPLEVSIGDASKGGLSCATLQLMLIFSVVCMQCRYIVM